RLLTVDFSFEMDRKRRVLCVAARACRGFPHAIVLQPYVGRSGELRSTSLCWTGRYLTQQDSSAQKWALPLYNSCTKRCQNAGHYDFDTGSFRNLQAKHHTFVAHDVERAQAQLARALHTRGQQNLAFFAERAEVDAVRAA